MKKPKSPLVKGIKAAASRSRVKTAQPGRPGPATTDTPPTRSDMAYHLMGRRHVSLGKLKSFGSSGIEPDGMQ